MKSLALEIRNTADGEGDLSTMALLEDHIVQYEKQLWFLSAMTR